MIVSYKGSFLFAYFFALALAKWRRITRITITPRIGKIAAISIPERIPTPKIEGNQYTKSVSKTLSRKSSPVRLFIRPDFVPTRMRNNYPHKEGNAYVYGILPRDGRFPLGYSHE